MWWLRWGPEHEAESGHAGIRRGRAVGSRITAQFCSPGMGTVVDEGAGGELDTLQALGGHAHLLRGAPGQGLAGLHLCECSDKTVCFLLSGSPQCDLPGFIFWISKGDTKQMPMFLPH